MATDKKICRLCLQFIGKEGPYVELTKDSAIFPPLKSISCDIVDTLHLAKQSLVCKLCENKVKDFKRFRDRVVLNEFKLQQNQKPNLRQFLENISKNVEAICRLCLTASEEKNPKLWQDRKIWFMHCNIHLNKFITEPNKICSACDTSLQNMYDFLIQCRDIDKSLVLLVTKKAGKTALTEDDIYLFALSRAGSSKKTDDTRTIKKSVVQFVSQNVEKSAEKPPNKLKNEDLLPITKTLNKYERSSKEFKHLDAPSTSDGSAEANFIFKKMDKKQEQMHSSIDALPVSDLSNITLEVNDFGMVTEEPVCEYNATQELIDVLEGTLNEQLESEKEDGKKDPPRKRGRPRKVTEDSSNLEKGEMSNETIIDLEARTVKGSDVAVVKKKETSRRRGRPPKNEVSNLESDDVPQPRKRGRPRKDATQATIATPRIHQTIINAFKSVANKTVENDVQAPTEISEVHPLEADSDNCQSDVVAKSEVEPSTAQEVANNESSDDEFTESPSEKNNKRPVMVTIIKNKGSRIKKGDLDKTWQQLTGGSANDSGLLNGGMEIVVKKRGRGRPRLYPVQPKKRKDLIWFYCDKCAFKTYAKHVFTQHQLIHNVLTNVPNLCCDVCRYTTTNPEFLTQHKATHDTPNLLYKCIFCEEYSKRKTSCMYHMLRHDDRDVASQFYCMVFNATTEDDIYECFQCSFHTSDETIMPDHVIEHTIEKLKNPLVAKFKCKLCNYCTKSEDMMTRHKHLHEMDEKNPGMIKMKHASPQETTDVLQCDKCHFITRYHRSLVNHVGKKHSIPTTIVKRDPSPIPSTTNPSNEDKPVYYCNECSYSTTRKTNLPRHSVVHRTKETMEFFECPHCIFETKHKRSYGRHMMALHGILI